MTSVAIYTEGGGRGPAGKAALRQGMEAFLKPLKDTARARSWRWSLVCCGGRAETFRAFAGARSTSESGLVVLLVDAEAAVRSSPRTHLRSRDGWDLSETSDEVVHLMIQVMETRIIADPKALAAYYGRGFSPKQLPKARDLESVPKATIAKSLDKATRRTQKGTYHKINHASGLLKLINRQEVAKRCPSCQRRFDTLAGLIATHGR